MHFTYRNRRHGISVIRIEGFDTRDHIYRRIQAGGTFYELDLLRYLEGMLSKSGRAVVIDVGANIGNHAIFFAKYVASHVIAVEPNGAVLPVLERNLRNNTDDPSSWSIVASALGAVDGVGVLEVPGEAGANVGMARIRQPLDGEEAGDRVTVRTLDRLVTDYYDGGRLTAPVRLIKIDVEGMEVDVLNGATGVIERFSPDIAVEAKDISEKARIDEVLEPLGYVAVSRHCATPTYHYVRHPSRRLVLSARVRGFMSYVRRVLP